MCLSSSLPPDIRTANRRIRDCTKYRPESFTSTAAPPCWTCFWWHLRWRKICRSLSRPANLSEPQVTGTKATEPDRSAGKVCRLPDAVQRSKWGIFRPPTSPGSWTPEIYRIRNGYHRKRSGDLVIDVLPGWTIVSENGNENKVVRHSYIPAPLIFMGHSVKPVIIQTPVTIDHIAPTLAHFMRIRLPMPLLRPLLPIFGKDPHKNHAQNINKSAF